MAKFTEIAYASGRDMTDEQRYATFDAIAEASDRYFAQAEGDPLASARRLTKASARMAICAAA